MRTSEISEPQFDVIVIGAGINGAGIARDAAMRGLKVLLLDKGDIGGGTSSWSTRLIHGGLRYLEHGEFRLVRESLRERECLMKIAPHLVRPLAMLVPVYQRARRGWWTIRAGMIAYDLLSFDKKLGSHQMLSRAETLARVPGVNSSGLLGAATYFDAQVEFAERLVVENVLSALEHGATAVTYARVDKLLIEAGRVCGVSFTTEVQSPKSKVQSPGSQLRSPRSKVQDEMSQGQEGGLAPALTAARNSNPPGMERVATARVVINAAGPWVDQLLAQAKPADSPRLVGGTKGSHIIVAPFAGAPDTAIYVEAETDGRPFFIIPWNGNLLIGTTDITYDGDLDQVRIDDLEIDYLLRETNRVIPQANLTRPCILYTYSGVRPLPFTSNDDQPSITRRHFIRRHPQVERLFSIVGGKLTTYRNLAEETVDLVLRELGRNSPACTTDQSPLPGAFPNFEDLSKHFQQHSGLSEMTNDHLLRVYGTRASLILDLVTGDASLAEVFDDETGAIAGEVVFAFKLELAQTLGDCLLRRTMVGLNSSCGLDAVEAAARVARKHLDWSADRVELEITKYRQQVSRGFRA